EEIGAENGIHAGQLDDLLGVLRGEHLPFAQLAPFVAMRKVERGLAGSAVQDEVRVGNLDAAEVIEVVGLSEARVPERSRRSLHDRDRVLPDRVIDGRPPRSELLRRKVRSEKREPLLRRRSNRPDQETDGEQESKTIHDSQLT